LLHEISFATCDLADASPGLANKPLKCQKIGYICTQREISATHAGTLPNIAEAAKAIRRALAKRKRLLDIGQLIGY
jgi:hypothetical protein